MLVMPEQSAHQRLGSYRAVLPVADNLLQIGGGVEQEMLPPFVPVQSHGAVHVNTAHRQKKKRLCSLSIISVLSLKLDFHTLTFTGPQC